METIKYLLFKKKTKNQLDRDLLFLTLFVIGLALLWLGGENYLGWEVLESIGLLILGFAGLTYLFFGFYSLSEKERLNGDFTGHIEFEKDKIIVGDQVFNLGSLSKIEIYSEDYIGKKEGTQFSVVPKVSNGVGNYVRLKTKEGSVFQFNFQLNSENEFEKKMKDLLIQYHLKDKISFLALIQYICISNNYGQIQQFKKELEEMKA
jgi:hypothetical protein